MSGAEVALLRHFPTDWNRARRLQGRTDRPLTPDARAALAALAPPPPWDRARAIASPLARARDTAAALWPAFDTDPRLMELDYGGWEGRSIDDLLADPDSRYVAFDRWGWDRRAPGGESPRDAWARVASLLAEIAAGGRPTVLVAHRGLMRAILAVAHGWDYDRPEPFAIRRGRLHLVTLDAAGAPAPGPTLRLAPR
jgi:probable phosphoglycerate mutase